jgi:two-component system CheB/CheR fusion protein
MTSSEKDQTAVPEVTQAPTDNTSVNFPIVGIGASAGGLAAFEAFFSGMPADIDPGMAFILVQHLAPDHKSILAELIRHYTRMEVFEVEDGMKVKPNCVYIIPPNSDMAFINGTLQLFEPVALRGQRLPIDFLFRSLARDQHERAIGIVLSGTGSDGTLGLRAIKGESGMVMVQNPDSAEYDGMPHSVIATGLADFELPPSEMPARIMDYVAHAFCKPPLIAAAMEPNGENELKKIFCLLRTQTGHDFSNYKPSTIHRRIERRMAVHRLDRLDVYVKYLQQTPVEVEALFRDLLIGVTSFFRDPAAFKALEEHIIPKLFAGKPADSTIRVWSAGCSTGEEAYSIAMLLREQMDTLKQSFKVQIFATDIDSRAIAAARSGIYPANIAADISPERLARFFTAELDGSAYRIHKGIRDMLVFSEHDIIKDPPFSKLDLISCRNLMIYISGGLQKKLILLFHYALNPGGMLFLGTSETVGNSVTLFTPLDQKAQLYQRKEYFQNGAQSIIPVRLLPTMPASIRTPGNVAAFKPPICEHSAVPPHRPATKKILHCPGLRVKTNVPLSAVNMTITGTTGAMPELPLYLVKPQEEPGLSHGGISDGLACGREQAALYDIALSVGSMDADGFDRLPTDARIAALEQQLLAKEEFLQTSNEEFKSTNEEMQSVNEELQSTNEELETSKEELQSVNEELNTVNAELQTNITDLSRANNDMNNLLAGTGIGTVFVDHQLRILRFTPAATLVINLILSDVGRPLAHTVLNLVGYDRLVADTQLVLNTLIPREVDVQTTTGKWYTMRILPYRTLDNVIEGAAITFFDITEMVQMRKRLKEANDLQRMAVVVRDAYDAITVQDLDGRILAWNQGAVRMYGWSEAEALAMNVRDRIPVELRDQALKTIHQLSKSEILEPYLTRRLAKDGTVLEVSIISTALMNETGRMYAIATTERAK